MNLILSVFTSLFFVRLVTLYISIKNEKRLKHKGGIEFGKKNSILLSIVHVIYYFSCLTEGFYADIAFNFYSLLGTFLLVFSYIMLFVVIYQLREIWTVKIYIVPGHRIVTTPLFKYIRHPNYLLNILPEVIGIALLCNAWYTLFIGLPIYCVILCIRIIQEEKAMTSLRKAAIIVQ